MGHQVFWDERHANIIHNIYTDIITLDDYYAVVDETYKMIRSVDHTVYTILRHKDIEKRPPNLMQVMRYASKSMPANIGSRFVVTNSPDTLITLTLIKVGKQLSLPIMNDVIIVKTLQEVYERVQVK